LLATGFAEKGECLVLPEGKDVTWMLEKIQEFEKKEKEIQLEKTGVTLCGRLVGLNCCRTFPSAVENRDDDKAGRLGFSAPPKAVEMEENCFEDELGGTAISRISNRIGCSKLKIIIGGRPLDEKKTFKAQGFLCNSFRKGKPLLVVFSASGGKRELGNCGGYSIADVTKGLYHERPTGFQVREAIEAMVDENASKYELCDPKSGKPVQLSLGAKKALCTAVALHAKGRELLSHTRRIRLEDRTLFDSTVGEALEFLVEADQCFQKCSEGVQSGSQSYGVEELSNFQQLQFDICWAYVLLNSTRCLPDAFIRLERAEKMVARHVDKKFMEMSEFQARNIKNEQINLKVLAPDVIPSVRLWLLRGIALQALGDTESLAKAKADLEKAHLFLDALHVPEDFISNLCQFMRDQQFPISRRKAIATLRRYGGRIDVAAQTLLNALMEKRKQRQYELEQYRLGTTIDGSLIILEHLKELTDMGIEKTLAVKALKKANNDVQFALKLVTRLQAKIAAQKELEVALASGEALRLQQAIEAADRQKIPVAMAKKRLDELLGNGLVDEESLAILLSMDFDKTVADQALRAAKGNMEDAIKLCYAASSSVEQTAQNENDNVTLEVAEQAPQEKKPEVEMVLSDEREEAEEEVPLNDLEPPEEEGPSSYPQCTVACCNRITWNCKENQTCCRTCSNTHGAKHGPDCNHRNNELCGARMMGQLEAYVQKRLRMAEYQELVETALGGTLSCRDAEDELAGAELGQEEAILRQVYFDKF